MGRTWLLLLLLWEASAYAAQEIRCPSKASEATAPRDRESCLVALEGIEAFRRADYPVAARKFEEALWMSVTFEPGRKEYWLGRALLGVGKTREAAFAFYRALRAEENQPEPDTALMGSIRLWLGKSYDLLGRRGAARGWYSEVVDSPAAAKDKEEARRYLGAPFRDDPAPAPPGVRELQTLLRDLMAEEEAYQAAHGAYTDELRALGLTLPKGVRVSVRLLDNAAGYVAEARRVRSETLCRVATGRGIRARDRGLIRCQ